MSIDLGKLVTEGRLSESLNIDQVSTLEMVQIINDQDKLVAHAVEKELPQIARGIDVITERLKQGGKLFYAGAGTSGRLGILDASEIPPTYGAPLDLFQGLIAGGERAILETQEGAEDSFETGEQEVLSKARPIDVVVGIAASGRTPYTLGALAAGRKLGCATIAVTNNPGSEMTQYAEITIAPVVGPEVVMGSTRMKAGTAQKLVLNMLSTGAMIKLGKVYSNLMVDMEASNAKLRRRAVRMVQIATGVDEAAAEKALAEAGDHSKTAIVSLLTGVPAAAARAALDQTNGFVRQAIELAKAGE